MSPPCPSRCPQLGGDVPRGGLTWGGDVSWKWYGVDEKDGGVAEVADPGDERDDSLPGIEEGNPPPPVDVDLKAWWPNGESGDQSASLVTDWWVAQGACRSANGEAQCAW